MDAPPTSVYLNILILILLFCYWSLAIFLKNRKITRIYTLKIRILKIPIFFVEKWLTFTRKKKTLPPTRVELGYGLNQRHYINNGSLLQAVQIFPWLPICRSNICVKLSRHILELPITDFSSCYAHFGPVLSIRPKMCNNMTQIYNGQHQNVSRHHSVFLRKRWIRPRVDKGKKEAGSMLCFSTFLCSQSG
jgi:hypothetical protein